MEGVLLAAEHDRVARVGAAGKAHDEPRVRGEVVDYLALALVAPLGADDHDVHVLPLIARSLGAASILFRSRAGIVGSLLCDGHVVGMALP